MDYRSRTRSLLKQAKEKLKSPDEDIITYASLDLRMALECLVYEKAMMYEGEISSDQMRTWQPASLMKYILEIDPNADKSSTLSFKLDSELKDQSEPYKFLGTESVISIKDIKSYYNKLGSYLHVPTAEQLEKKGSIKLDQKIARCNQVVALIEKVLSSPIFNMNFKQLVDIACDRCNSKIVRRIPLGEKLINVTCTTNNCIATYTMKVEGQKVTWRPIGVDVACPKESCDEKYFMWEEELKVATEWVCKGCSQKNKLALTSIAAEKLKS